MGQTAGTTTRYINPYTGKVVSDRYLDKRPHIKSLQKNFVLSGKKIGITIQG